jgi:hypothetical protein
VSGLLLIEIETGAAFSGLGSVRHVIFRDAVASSSPSVCFSVPSPIFVVMDKCESNVTFVLLGIKIHRYMVSLTGTDDDVDKATGIRVIPAARFLTAFA